MTTGGAHPMIIPVSFLYRNLEDIKYSLMCMCIFQYSKYWNQLIQYKIKYIKAIFATYVLVQTPFVTSCFNYLRVYCYQHTHAKLPVASGSGSQMCHAHHTLHNLYQLVYLTHRKTTKDTARKNSSYFNSKKLWKIWYLC